MQDNNLTSATDLEEYAPNDTVTRRDMISVLKTYAEQQDMRWIAWSNCSFNDIDALTEQEKDDIVDICSYEFLRGNNGAFRPESELTQAEMLAMVIRGNYWYLNEQSNPWYRSYYDKAVTLWLTKPGLDLWLFTEKLTKEDVARWLMAWDSIKEIDAWTLLVK